MLEEQPALRELYVKGEISNFSRNYQSGHCYFSLKDSSSSVKSVMFRSYADQMPFQPENGMQVIVRCSAALYERDCAFQLYVYEMQPDGLGAIYLAVMQLKEKLSAQGLFDENRKKAIPAYPSVVGIVTSPKAAAYRDMLAVLGRRWPLARVILAPAPVQGKGAAHEMAVSLQTLDRSHNCDLIIIGRGGGSVEDLWEFNSEELARAISACITPVISAVGHETDYTVCDLAADLRAPTPSAAAELAVPDGTAIHNRVGQLGGRLLQRENMQLLVNNERFSSLLYKFYANSPEKKLDRNGQTLVSLVQSLLDAAKDAVALRANALELFCKDISRLNPMEILSRGYSVTRGAQGIVRSTAELSVGDEITTILSNGEFHSTVTDISGGGYEKKSEL